MHTFAARKIFCNYPALIVIIGLKTHSLPFLLPEYNCVIVTTVLVYDVYKKNEVVMFPT